MRKTVVKLIKEGDDVTFEIDGKYVEIVALLSQALIDVARSHDDGKKIVTNACSIIIDEINE